MNSINRATGELAMQQPPPPCERHQCGSRQRCADLKLACKAFAVYVRTGRGGGFPDDPSRQIYSRVFSDD